MRILLVIVALLAANYLFVALFAPGKVEPVRVPYSPTFLEQVRDGNVERVSTTGATVDGMFKKDFKYQDARADQGVRDRDPGVRQRATSSSKLLEDAERRPSRPSRSTRAAASWPA